MLELRQLAFSYPTHEVLRPTSLRCEVGQSVLLLGDNGSGKSTLGRLIAGLHLPTEGQVLVGGHEVGSIPLSQRPAHVVYVSQVSYLQFFAPTIDDEIALACRQRQRPRPEPAVVSAFSLPPGSTNPRDLSYPEMWRLQILLLGAVFSPSVLFIDEIVAPAIPAQQTALRWLLEARATHGCTWLTYQRHIGERFDRVITIEGGILSER